MRNRKPQGFATPAHKKISTLPLPAAHPPGSIFLWQPLHLSIRSRVIALCLNISFMSASVAGGCRSVFGLAFGHSCLLSVPLASKRFSSGSCGLRSQFQSSLFRGLFFLRHAVDLTRKFFSYHPYSHKPSNIPPTSLKVMTLDAPQNSITLQDDPLKF